MKHNTELTDHELLELVVKAAYTDCVLVHYTSKQTSTSKYFLRQGGMQQPWNPLEHNSDALMLAVKQKLSIIQDLTEDVTSVYWTDIQCVNQAHTSDAYTSTRKAIVRAVAAKYMQENK